MPFVTPLHWSHASAAVPTRAKGANRVESWREVERVMTSQSSVASGHGQRGLGPWPFSGTDRSKSSIHTFRAYSHGGQDLFADVAHAAQDRPDRQVVESAAWRGIPVGDGGPRDRAATSRDGTDVSAHSVVGSGLVPERRRQVE